MHVFHPFLVKAKLEAKKRDLESSDKQLEDARQCLKEKVEECKAFEVSGRLVTLLMRVLFSLLTSVQSTQCCSDYSLHNFSFVQSTQLQLLPKMENMKVFSFSLDIDTTVRYTH